MAAEQNTNSRGFLVHYYISPTSYFRNSYTLLIVYLSRFRFRVFRASFTKLNSMGGKLPFMLGL